MSLSFLPDLITEVPIPFERGPLTAPSLIAMSPEKSAPICGRPAPFRSYPLIGGPTITPARPMTFGVASLTRDMRIPMSRGPFTGHIREERKSCTATRASHRRPRAPHKDWGSSRPRPWRTAADSASPWKGLSAKSSSSEREPMPAPPALVTRGQARCGGSPSSSTAPGFSPRGPL